MNRAYFYKSIIVGLYLFLNPFFVEAIPTKVPIPRPAQIRLTLQQLEITKQILQQIELATQEVGPYLEIMKPLEQLSTTTNVGSDKGSVEKRVILRLPIEATSNLLLFMQRANIPALGAQEINKIVNIIQKSLPKGNSSEEVTERYNQVSLSLNTIESRFLQQLLEQIEIAVSEVEPFLDIYLPLQDVNKKSDATLNLEKEQVIKLSVIAPKNLLLFLERTRITGQQARLVHNILEKLKQLLNKVAADTPEIP